MFGNCGGLDTGDLKYSLKFTRASSEYMSKALTTPTDNKKFSVSFWIQRTGTGTTQGIYTNAVDGIFFNASDQLDFYLYDIDIGTTGRITTTATYTSTSSVYHVLCVCDTTSATTTITGSSSDRVRVYVDGVQISSFSSSSVPLQNSIPMLNRSAITNELGRFDTYTNYFLDAKLSRFVFIDGQALGPSSFGRYNASGQWISKTVSEIAALASGTGANNVMLEFNDNSSASALGNDNSTKNNDYTVYNLSTSDRTINY